MPTNKWTQSTSHKIRHRHVNNSSNETWFQCTSLKRKVSEKVHWIKSNRKRMQIKLIQLIMWFVPVKNFQISKIGQKISWLIYLLIRIHIKSITFEYWEKIIKMNNWHRKLKKNSNHYFELLPNIHHKMRYYFFQFHIHYVPFFFIISGTFGGRFEKKLLRDLMVDYDNLERPVVNESHPLLVTFGITLQQIIDVVSFIMGLFHFFLYKSNYV